MEIQLHPQRRPLQPKNIQRDDDCPKAKPTKLEANAGKENNYPFEVITGASLAEELSIVRRRREKLRLERESAERWLDEKERVWERGLREMERRWEEQEKIELEIERLVLVMELVSSVLQRVSPMQSLRAREEEKRETQLKESKCAATRGQGSEQLSMQEKGAEN